MLANVDTKIKTEIECNASKLAFLRELEESPNVYNICNKLGVSRTLIYNEWLQKDEEFKRRYEAIMMGNAIAIEGSVFNTALHNEKAFMHQALVLNNWLPERYGRRDDRNVTINIDLSPNALSTIDKARALMSIEDAQYSVVEPAQIPANSSDKAVVVCDIEHKEDAK